MKLIDKAAVVAEIYRLRDFANYRWDIEEVNGVDKFLDKLIPYINTLEVKEVDLENAYKVDIEIAREKSILDETKVEYFTTGKPIIAAYSEDNLRNQFDAGAYWMKEQIIKALKENNYATLYNNRTK